MNITNYNSIKISCKLNKDGRTYTLTEFVSDDKKVILPSHFEGKPIITIAEKTFYQSDYIEITIPNTYRFINDSAFANSNKLVNVNMSNRVIKFGEYVFQNCKSLKSFIFPVNINEINHGFFEGCESLKRVYTPKNLEKIKPCSFHGCKSLRKIHLPNTLYSIFSSAFAKCESLEQIVLPKGLKEIGSGAFAGCITLKEINIPKSVVSLGSSIFSGCYASINFENGSSLKELNDCFSGYLGTEIFISKNIEKLDRFSHPFSGCLNLEKVVVDDENEKFYAIDGVLYSYFDGLILYPRAKKDSSFLIQKNTHISGSYFAMDVFEGCKNLQEFIVDDENISFQSINGVLFNKPSDDDELTLVKYPEGKKDVYYALPNETKRVGRIAFSNLQHLKEITLNEGLREIGFDAFINSSNLVMLLIPDSVEDISNHAFDGCEFPVLFGKKSSIKDITYAFRGYKGKEIKIPFGVVDIKEDSFEYAECNILFDEQREVGAYENTIFANMLYKKTRFEEFEEELDLDKESENSIDYRFPLRTLSDFAFRQFYGKEIVLPRRLKKVGRGAFYNCKNLKSLHFPNELEEEQKYDFFRYKSRIFNTLDELKYLIYEDTFKGCISLTDVILPNNIEMIGREAFASCLKLEKIVIPSTVKYIEQDAFKDCKSLININLPTELRLLKAGAFYGCESLKNINLPPKLTFIPEALFYNCTALEEIIIPESVKKIYRGAFQNCISLKKVVIPDSVEIIENGAFFGCTSLVEIKMPQRLMNSKIFEELNDPYSPRFIYNYRPDRKASSNSLQSKIDEYEENNGKELEGYDDVWGYYNINGHFPWEK